MSLEDEMKENESVITQCERTLALTKIGYDLVNAAVLAKKLEGLNDIAFQEFRISIERRRAGDLRDVATKVITVTTPAPAAATVPKKPEPEPELARKRVQASVVDYMNDFLGVDADAAE